MTKYLLATSLFLFSLNQFSVRATALAYTIAFVIYLLNYRKIISPFSYSHILFFLLANAFALGISIRHGVYLNYYWKFFAISLYILCLLHGYKAEIIDGGKLAFASRLVVVMHASFFLIQLTAYLYGGHFIDFNNYVREVDSETLFETKALADSFISIRATGLFSEPSFYALSILPFSIFLLVRNKRLTAVPALGLATSVLSFSVAAIAVVAGIILVYVMSSKGEWIKKSIVILLFSLASIGLSNFVKLRVVDGVDYDAIESRSHVFDELESRLALDNFVGGGLFWDEREPIGQKGLRGYHIRDSSFFVYLYYTTGIIGVLIFTAFLLRLFYRTPVLLFYMLIMLSMKFHVLYGTLWLLVFFFYIERCERLQVRVRRPLPPPRETVPAKPF